MKKILLLLLLCIFMAGCAVPQRFYVSPTNIKTFIRSVDELKEVLKKYKKELDKLKEIWDS